MRIIVDERTKRQGTVIQAAKTLYHRVGQDEALRIVNTLNRNLDLPEGQWRQLVTRLLPAELHA